MITWHRFSQTMSLLIFFAQILQSFLFISLYVFHLHISYLALIWFYKRVNIRSLSRDAWQPKSFPNVSLEKSLGQRSPTWDRSTRNFSVTPHPGLCHQCWGFNHMKEDMLQKCQSPGAPWEVWKSWKFRTDSMLLWVRWQHVKAWSLWDF